MTTRITQRSVEAIRPAERDVKIWDSEIPGFGVKVTPKGRRVYILQYWAPGRAHTRRTLTIGVHGTPVKRLVGGLEVTVDLTAHIARELAREFRADVQRGADPAGARGDARQATKLRTLAALSDEFLDECRAKRKASTATEYSRIFRQYLIPAFGRHVVDGITTRDVANLHLRMRETPAQANRCLAVLSAFLNWCNSRNYRAQAPNPCAQVTPYPERARERFLNADELARLQTALDTAVSSGLPPAPELRRKAKSKATAKHRPKSADKPQPANPYAVAAIRFLFYTGWREQEALTLRWDAVDLTSGIATLNETKTGKVTHQLAEWARRLLETLPRVEGSPYVFPGKDPSRPLREIKRVWSAVRYAARLQGVRLHDIRHTAASFGVGAGLSLYQVGKLLGHKRASTTQRYAHIHAEIEKRAANTQADAIHAALTGQRTEVLPLPVQRRRARR